MNGLFTSGGQSIGASASASILPINIHVLFPSGLTGLISLLLRDSEESSPTPQFKSISFQHSAFFMVQLSHWYMTTGRKSIALTIWTFVGKVMSLLNMLPRFVIAFLPRSKHLLISCLQSPSAVILEPKNGTRCHDLSFLNVEF